MLELVEIVQPKIQSELSNRGVLLTVEQLILICVSLHFSPLQWLRHKAVATDTVFQNSICAFSLGIQYDMRLRISHSPKRYAAVWEKCGNRIVERQIFRDITYDRDFPI